MIFPRLAIKVGTAFRLGLPNILRVTLYRIACRLGVGPSSVLPVAVPAGDLFTPVAPSIASWPVPPALEPLQYFGWRPLERVPGSPPDWFLNPFTERRFDGPERPWHVLPDFDASVGDIKCIWELSRWDWLLRLAQNYLYGAEPIHLKQINGWLQNWLKCNPGYLGPNWKCGQEASIRVMHLAFAARLLGQVQHPSDALLALVRLHLQRIAPTIQYAVAQDNNHGTGEAAALFIGGSWLAAQDGDAPAARWAHLGRKWLENRVGRLVMADGSFSQYSVNYHRLMLDTLATCELWRREMTLPQFSPLFLERAAAATTWLRDMVQPETGDAPNIGANDGACLLPLTDSDYRDFRPSVQLAAALFIGARAYRPGPWDAQLAWLGVAAPERLLPAAASRCYNNGGYAVMREGDVTAYVRYPRFRFRPSHADALHLDLWRNGENWLRDGGTYSYNASEEHLQYFPGTASHNTVQFDDRDQMPRLSRFLFGAWLETRDLQPVWKNEKGSQWAATCHDWRGARHRREVILLAQSLRVVDTVSGFQQNAVLRWRLRPGNWRLENGCLSGEALTIRVDTGGVPAQIRLVDGLESRYYHRLSALPVLEVAVTDPCTLVSHFSWA
jgi:hypothetical protein